MLSPLNFALLRAEALLHGLQLAQFRRHAGEPRIIVFLHDLELSLVGLPLVLICLVVSQLDVELGSQLLVFVDSFLVLDASLINLLLMHLAFKFEGASLRVQSVQLPLQLLDLARQVVHLSLDLADFGVLLARIVEDQLVNFALLFIDLSCFSF